VKPELTQAEWKKLLATGMAWELFPEGPPQWPWILNAGEGWAEKYTPEPDTVIISITEPLEQGNILKRQEPARLKPGYVDILRLEFQDYDATGRHAAVMPEDSVPFNQKMAARVSRFLRKHRGKNIIVHCAAGISRSAGIVEAALQAFPEYEDKGWARFANNHVKTLMKRALGLVPIGAEDDKEPEAEAGKAEVESKGSKGRNSYNDI
jgi:predicted protein tyrosine phosphatase